MALCLPRRRRATSLATLPKTLSVASITNHSCVTSAALALKVFMGTDVGSSLLLDRWSATLRGGALSPDRVVAPANEDAFRRGSWRKAFKYSACPHRRRMAASPGWFVLPRRTPYTSG